MKVGDCANGQRPCIEARVLSPEEVQALEPDVKVSARGGVYFPGDAHFHAKTGYWSD